jgi:hypothetical protein
MWQLDVVGKSWWPIDGLNPDLEKNVSHIWFPNIGHLPLGHPPATASRGLPQVSWS